MKLRPKVSVLLLLLLFFPLGLLGFSIHSMVHQFSLRVQNQESLFLRRHVLEVLRFHLEEMEAATPRCLEELFPEEVPPCSPEEKHRGGKVDFAVILTESGKQFYCSRVSPDVPLVLPPWEACTAPPLSEDRFLWGSVSEDMYLLAVSPRRIPEEFSPGERAVLIYGKNLSGILPWGEKNGDQPALECTVLTETSASKTSIVQEIQGSHSPVMLKETPGNSSAETAFLLSDWRGRPVVLIESNLPGEIAATGQRTLRMMYLLLLLLGGLLFGTIFLTAQRLVILRLQGLAEGLSKITEKKQIFEKKERLPLRGNDEITQVSSAVNTLLDSMEETRREERHNEQQLLALAKNIPGVVYRSSLDRNFTKIFVSENFKDFTGYDPEDILGNHHIALTDITHPEDRTFLLTDFWRKLEEEDTYSIYYRLRKKDGEYIWVHDCGQITRDDITGVRFIDGVMLDMTELKSAELRLQEERSRYKELTNSLPQTIFETDIRGTITFMNQNGYSAFGYSRKSVEEGTLPWLSLFRKEDQLLARRCMKRLFRENREVSAELVARTAEGTTFPGAIYINPLRKAGEIQGVLGIIIDLSTQKTMEEKLRFLSMHDSLTGLYNRAFFEEETLRMETQRFDPLGAIMCDLDGLKLVNDTMGHAAGDRLLIAAAGILRQSFRSSDVIARVGGDEFAILLPQCPEEQIQTILQRLRENLDQYNRQSRAIPLSISLGYACRNHENPAEAPSISVEGLVQEADAVMYRQKLKQSAEVRRSFVERLHQNYCNQAMSNARQHQLHARKIMFALWDHLDKPQNERSAISLLALFHDIGYIGIPQELPSRPGPLTEEEWRIIRRHPEIGHRIALSSPDLTPVAEWILRHHERWDGKGYPLELRETEIPEVCRLFALADTYTCMLLPRPFQEACSPEEALEEIRKCRGTQFDPFYTDVFLSVMNDHPELHYPDLPEEENNAEGEPR